jgi:hypothetical protein
VGSGKIQEEICHDILVAIRSSKVEVGSQELFDQAQLKT